MRAAVGNVFALLAGAVFAVGLMLSGMTQPSRVIGFLDVTRDWDPSLAFVMAGAVVVYGVAYRWWSGGRGEPWYGAKADLSVARHIDRRLVTGAAIFGVGWGLAGFCPGPGVVAAASGATTALVFLGAMLVGMAAQHAVMRDD